VLVDGQLAPDRVPPGNIPRDKGDAFESGSFPAGSFDFFPYCGIHRPVILYVAPTDGIADLTVVTEIIGQMGRLHIRLNGVGGDNAMAQFSLHGIDISAETAVTGDSAEVVLDVPDARFWSPEIPHLYDLTVQLKRGASPFDQYTLPIGIRT